MVTVALLELESVDDTVVEADCSRVALEVCDCSRLLLTVSDCDRVEESVNDSEGVGKLNDPLFVFSRIPLYFVSDTGADIVMDAVAERDNDDDADKVRLGVLETESVSEVESDDDNDTLCSFVAVVEPLDSLLIDADELLVGEYDEVCDCVNEVDETCDKDMLHDTLTAKLTESVTDALSDVDVDLDSDDDMLRVSDDEGDAERDDVRLVESVALR